MLHSGQEDIPFGRPYIAGNEAKYVAKAIAMRQPSGDGLFTRQAEMLISKLTGASESLLTTSCTHALELVALLLDIQSGDEVIIPSFTFPSVANAFVLRGATPVFVDCRLDTLNMDEGRVEEAITPYTRAIVVVHYAGVACEMDKITRIGQRWGIPIIEDNAHGLTGRYRGKRLGSLGVLATQSFHSTKNFHCGEGGALLVNDIKYLDRANCLRDKGTNRREFMRGKIDKYEWVDVGSSYLMSELQAAALSAQLEDASFIQERRHKLWHYYHENLAAWAGTQGLQVPAVPAECDHPAHIFYLLATSGSVRDSLIEHLSSRGIKATFHYRPLHSSPAGRRIGRCGPSGCKNSESVAERIVRLPLYPDLSDADRARIVEAVRLFRT